MSIGNVEISVFGAPAETQFLTSTFHAAGLAPGDLFSLMNDLSTRDNAEAVGFMGDRWFLSFAKPQNRQGGFVMFSEETQEGFGWTEKNVANALLGAEILISPERDTHPPDAPHLITSNEAEFLRVHGPEPLLMIEEAVRQGSPEISPFLTQVIVDRRHFPIDSLVVKTDLLRDLIEWLRQILESAEVTTTEGDMHLRNDLVALLINGFMQHAKHIGGATVRTLDSVRRLLPPCSVRPEVICEGFRERSAAPKTEPRSASEAIHIAVAFDRGYVPHAAVTIQSALEASADPSRLHFHVLQGGDLDEVIQAQLSQSVERFGSRIQFHQVCAKELAWLPLNRDHISIASYYRLTMQGTLPTSVERVIYVDCDTVVVDDLAKLWQVPLKGCPVAACLDEGGLRQSQRLALKPGYRYFNAGVMIFDLAQIRGLDLEGDVQSVYRQYGVLITLQDQDLLNLVFQGSCRELPLRWNANTRLFVPNELEPAYSKADAAEAAKDPGILHFTDRRKPWHDKSLNPMGQLYWDVRSRTLWPEERSERLRRLVVGQLRHRFSRSQRDLDTLLAELRKQKA